jgi:CheY-like chemotaxis protein
MGQEGKGYRILIADDEPELVDLVRMVLQMEGYEVVGAGDGLEAIKRARYDLPDLILLDVNMPKMNGLNVLEHLKGDPLTVEVPVIMLSVVTTYPEVRMALQRGADAYLPKPFELKALTRMVGRVLATDPEGRNTLREQALRTIGKV